MAASNLSSRQRTAFDAICRFALAALPLLAAPAGAAEVKRGEQGFTWSADVVSSDFRKDTLDLTGSVRVTQGVMSIEAGRGMARNFRSPDSRWTFQDSVRIRTAEADLHSNVASAKLVNGQIADARAEGSPAQFEQRTGPADRQVRGRAGVIEYDFAAGIVKLTDQVWFSNGKDEFRGDVVIYNVRDERVQINPGQSSGRVRGIIRPRNQTTQITGSTEGPNESAAAEPAAASERLVDETGA
jgi:lipopolysaccharide transport protein LptA